MSKAFARRAPTKTRKRESRLDKPSWTAVLQEFFQQISEAIAQVDLGSRDYEVFDQLVVHSLNCFSYYTPKYMTAQDVEKAYYSLLSLDSLDKIIQDRIRKFCAENFEEVDVKTN